MWKLDSFADDTILAYYLLGDMTNERLQEFQALEDSLSATCLSSISFTVGFEASV